MTTEHAFALHLNSTPTPVLEMMHARTTERYNLAKATGLTCLASVLYFELERTVSELKRRKERI